MTAAIDGSNRSYMPASADALVDAASGGATLMCQLIDMLASRT